MYFPGIVMYSFPILFRVQNYNNISTTRIPYAAETDGAAIEFECDTTYKLRLLCVMAMDHQGCKNKLDPFRSLEQFPKRSELIQALIENHWDSSALCTHYWSRVLQDDYHQLQ